MKYEDYLYELKNSIYLLYYSDIITDNEFIELIERWKDKNNNFLIKNGELGFKLNKQEE